MLQGIVYRFAVAVGWFGVICWWLTLAGALLFAATIMTYSQRAVGEDLAGAAFAVVAGALFAAFCATFRWIITGERQAILPFRK